MSGEVISLNVGGTIFVTSVATLTKYPNSMLAAMFDPKSERPPARKDNQGNFFIDSDPEPFKVILRFLRRGKLGKDLGSCTLEQLEWEADYFGLEEVLKIIEKRKKAEEEKEETSRLEMLEMKALEYEEKAAEMGKKSGDAVRLHFQCEEVEEDHDCFYDDPSDRFKKAIESACDFRHLEREYQKKADDLRRDVGRDQNANL